MTHGNHKNVNHPGEREQRFREELGREMTAQERRFLDYAETALEDDVADPPDDEADSVKSA